MRIIKLGIISFIVFFGITTAISLMIPSHIRISKAINLMAESDSVFSLIKDTSRWKEWHPAFADRNTFNSNLKIQPISQNDSEVIIQMQQTNRRPLINGWQIHRFSPTDSLTLQWYMDFNLPWYPWQKFSSLFYENTFGVMMQQGLANIKQKVEKQ